MLRIRMPILFLPAPIGGGTGIFVNIAGVWKTAVCWVNVAGTWKQATVYVNVGGVWK